MTDQSPKKPGAKILVVEDDKTISDMLMATLIKEGYEVLSALDGDMASLQLAKFQPDLVLLDLHVPNKSGFELLQEIRRSDNNFGAFVPVIVLTGVYTSRNDMVTSLDAGADDFLTKPFDLLELLARVRSLLRVQELYKRSQFLATHDPLTRCYNRRYMMDFLNRSWERYKRYKEPVAFLLIDLDHFKNINDAAGHEAGDHVLFQLGFALQDFFRAVDCLARLGGDEFAAILPGCSPKDAVLVGERLVGFMGSGDAKKRLPAKLAGMVSCSVGIACIPEHTEDKEELMRLADVAMYEAKKSGRNQVKMAKI